MVNPVQLAPIPQNAVSNEFIWREYLTKVVPAINALISKFGTYTTDEGAQVVVMGDSLSAQNNFVHDAWPQILQRNMPANGAPIQVTDIAIDAHTFFRSYNTKSFNGKSQLEYAISLKPEVLIVCLGFNDTITQVDGRTITQVQADADYVFSTLKAALPNTKIVHIGCRPHDSTYAPASLKNYGVIPYLFTLKSSGILANTYCSEMLTDSLSSATQTLITNWNTLNTHIQSISGLSFGTIEYWKIARLGLINKDTLHPTAMGSYLQAGYVQKALLNQTWSLTKWPQAIVTSNYLYWNDPDTVFSTFLTSAGSGAYTTNYDINTDTLAEQFISQRVIIPDTWYLPTKAKFGLYPTTVAGDPSSYFTWTLRDGPPTKTMYVSVGGAAWAALAVPTDAVGYGTATGQAYNFNAGVYTFRYKVDNEVYGPFTFTVQTDNRPFVQYKMTSPQAVNIGGYTLVKYNSADYDNNSNYSSSTGAISLSKPGYYQIDATAWLDTLAANGQIFLVICTGATQGSGAWRAGGAFAQIGTSAGSGGCSVSDVFYSSSGTDTLSIQLFQSGGGSANIIAGTGNIASHLTVKYLGQ